MQPSLSYILLVHNAQDTLDRQVARLLDVLGDLAARFELVVVDDGSTDQTAEVAVELARRYPQIRLEGYGRPRGPEAAVRTGVIRATGDIVLVQPEGEVPGAAELGRIWQRHGGQVEIRPDVRPAASFAARTNVDPPAAPQDAPSALPDWRTLLDRVRRFALQL